MRGGGNKKGPPARGGPSFFQRQPLRLEADVRTQVEPATVVVVEARSQVSADQVPRTERIGVRRVIAGQRRGLVEQVIHTEAQVHIIGQRVAAEEMEDVVRRRTPGGGF